MQPTGVLDTAKATNPLKDLLKFGQSVWLDYIRRDLITSGELKRLIQGDGLRGMTSNPAIFEKAIAGSTDYADILASLKDRPDLDAKARYEIIAIRDIQDVAEHQRHLAVLARGLSACCRGLRSRRREIFCGWRRCWTHRQRRQFFH